MCGVETEAAKRSRKDTPQSDGAQRQPIAAGYNDSYTIGMKTAISLPDKLFHDADAAAKQLGVSRSELYAKALEAYLAHRNAVQITARLDTVYGATDGRIDSSLAASQVRRAREDHW